MCAFWATPTNILSFDIATGLTKLGSEVEQLRQLGDVHSNPALTAVVSSRVRSCTPHIVAGLSFRGVAVAEISCTHCCGNENACKTAPTCLQNFFKFLTGGLAAMGFELNPFSS